MYTQLPLDNITINTVSDNDIDDGTSSGNGNGKCGGGGPASSYENGEIVRGMKVIPGSTTCDDPEDTVFTGEGDGMTSVRTNNDDGSYTITNYWRGMASSGTTYYPDGSQQNFQY